MLHAAAKRTKILVRTAAQDMCGLGMNGTAAIHKIGSLPMEIVHFIMGN